MATYSYDPAGHTQQNSMLHGGDINLLVRIGVLENELKNTNLEKDRYMHSLTTVIEYLPRVGATHPQIQPAVRHDDSGSKLADEREVDRLRKENKQLRRRVRELSDITRRRSDSSCTLQDSPSTDDEVVVSADSQKVSLQDMDKGLLTGVNADIGLHTLEDVLENDGIPMPLSKDDAAGNFIKAVDQEYSLNTEKMYMDNERPIDEQLDEQRKAMEKFNSQPTPTVLKVGGTSNHSFRGQEYDPNAPVAHITYPTGPRGWRQDQPLYRHQRRGARDFDAEGTQFENSALSEPYGNQNTFPNALWKSGEEKKGAWDEHARHRSSDGIRFPGFFRHGIQYLPQEGENNFLRTVHLTMLPRMTSLRDVLCHVRGGEIVSATLLDTKKINGSLSARIVFKNEGSAEEYVRWTSAHPIFMDEKDDDEKRKVEVSLIETPTYPVNLRMKQKLSFASRCICITNFPDDIHLGRVEYDIVSRSKFRADALLEFWMDNHATLHLQFSNLDMSGSAIGILTKFRYYAERMLDVFYEPDPCAGPLEELFEPAKLRPRIGSRTYLSKPTEEGSKSVDMSGSGSEGTKIVSTRVQIPSFSGAGLAASSWADEVNDEIAASDVLKVAYNTLPLSFSGSGSLTGQSFTKHEENLQRTSLGEVVRLTRYSSQEFLTSSEHATENMPTSLSELGPPFLQLITSTPSVINDSGLQRSGSPLRIKLEDLISEDDALSPISDTEEVESKMEKAQTLLIPEAFDTTPIAMLPIESSDPTTPTLESTKVSILEAAGLPMEEITRQIQSRIHIPAPAPVPVPATTMNKEISKGKVKEMKVESTISAFRATNMDGGRNPDEIKVHFESDF